MPGGARELVDRNVVRNSRSPGQPGAVVSDSFDLFNVVESFWGDDLRDDVRDSGGTVPSAPTPATRWR